VSLIYQTFPSFPEDIAIDEVRICPQYLMVTKRGELLGKTAETETVTSDVARFKHHTLRRKYTEFCSRSVFIPVRKVGFKTTCIQQIDFIHSIHNYYSGALYYYSGTLCFQGKSSG
jgi:hypothetical protein